MPTKTIIDKLERADGRDRELDAEIAILLGWTVYTGDNWIGPHGEIAVPAYTASFDAAMTLVPTEPYPELRPGHWWWMLEVREAESVAHIAYENYDAGIPEFEGKASTPALALCIAALRARSQGGE